MKAHRARWSACALLFVTAHELVSLSNLTKNDPYPVYTSADPYVFLRSREKQEIRGGEVYGPHEVARISFSIFRQTAKWGTNYNGESSELGDLGGRWNVLGLFYPESNGNTDTQQKLFHALGITSAEQTSCFNPNGVNLADPAQTDINKEFGFFKVPIKYRKQGVRFEVNLDLYCDFMFQIQMGVCDIRQTVTFLDLTCGATGIACPVRGCNTTESSCATNGTCPDQTCCIDIFNCECKKLTIDKIMKQFDSIITPTLGLNARDFHRTAAEDTRLSLYWSHLFVVNEFRGPSWAKFMITPFIAGQVSAPTGRDACPRVLFDLPSGNDGFWGYGFTTGVTIDWLETVEIAIEAGMTKWDKRTISGVPVPINENQSGVFPRFADLRVEPGTNWNFNATLSAYHFLDRLSFYAQFVMVDHSEDCFTLLSTTASTPATVDLKKMRELSSWQSMFVNSALNYDISPNIALGVLWQAPVKRRNAYYSTTVLGSLVVTF